MTTPNSKSRRNTTNGSSGDAVQLEGFSQETKARLFLLIACIWPLWVLALFGASSPGQATTPSLTTAAGLVHSPAAISNRLNLRHILDRVDIMGYGPTHPRVAVVVIGDEKDYVVSSVESVFRNTDLNRIFLICTVLDGVAEDPKLVEDLRKIDSGSVPHWHGLRPDIHDDNKEKGEDDPHGRKIHVVFNEERQGLTASRSDAVEFLSILERKHEEAGLKNPEEDLIVVFLQAGAQLTDHKWLPAVTSALIVPPPILNEDRVAMKLANAVSLRMEGPGQRTSFDEKLAPITNEASAEDINLSSGVSYPTPAFNGAGIALRMETFRNLPANDISLTDAWPANLELALNLWLCADGIDILQGAEVSGAIEANPSIPLEPDDAARFAAVWMDDATASKFLQAYSTQITRLDWETKMMHARQSPTFPKDMAKKCRSFDWYAREINSDLSQMLEQVGWSERKKVPAVAAAAAAEAVKEVKPLERQEVVKEPITPPKKEEPPPMEEKKEEVPVQEEKKEEAPPKKEEKEEPPPEEQQKEEAPPQEEEVDENVIPDLARNHRQTPKVPLRKTNLEIVQKAKPVDLTYVDVTNGFTEFPHMGAKDVDGNWGYVHDEKFLKKNPPKFEWEEERERRACMNRDNNYRMLTERVFVDTDYDEKQNESGAKRDKIFCLVYTIEPGHHRIPNILETWGPRCDGFMVGSNKTDPTIGAVNIPHEGPEEYNNIWQKVRSMWSYIYDNYYDEYDWFHIGGDDLFLIVENLKYYLESEEIKAAANGGIYLPDGTETVQTPLLLGRRFAYMGDLNDIFPSGGSGYTMNKAALKSLVVDAFPNYFPHAHTFSEDTMIAKLFRKMNVFPYDTQDEEHGERYMPFMPGHHYGYKLPKDPMNSKDWYAKYSIDIKQGPEHCSPRSVAFHYVKDEVMKRLFLLAYKLCPAEYMQN
mmetsp:Transcript_19576/g.30163  ORF Transcript_19576/g.30163 Transcript_19576/m.30163 type:complete len:932 (+) Transcript_19576:234-3029(+)